MSILKELGKDLHLLMDAPSEYIVELAIFKSGFEEAMESSMKYFLSHMENHTHQKA